jgi:hypothetical protein
MALAATLIKIGVELLAAGAVVLNFSQRGPFGTLDIGKGVAQVKRDELGEARFIAMWKIAALVPAAETERRVFALGRGGIAAFVGDKFTHPGIVGRPGGARFRHEGIELRSRCERKPVECGCPSRSGSIR